MKQHPKLEQKKTLSRYSAELNATVALEAIKEQRPVNELALPTPLQIPSDPLAKYPPFTCFFNGWGI